MTSGRAVIVNGTSSAGKSSIIGAFVERRAREGECWIAMGIDDFNAKLPWRWLDVPGVAGPFGGDGVRFVGDDDSRVVEVGDVGRRLFAAYRRSVAACVRAGLDVVVDEVAFDAEAVADWRSALGDLPVTWVGVRCDPEVAAAREAARGDRALGLARGLSAVVHEAIDDDLELDSTTATPEELAAVLARHLVL